LSATKRPTKTRTLTTTATRRDLQKAFREASLTHEEELVLRMRLGVPEPRTATLEYRGQDDAELATKLAMIESEAIDKMRPRLVEPEEGEELKSYIIERLKRT
jgi:DNA-directed RNA polymerase sigma subunit (sigma70/sigma32)